MATETVAKAGDFHLANGDEDVICPTCDAKIKRSQVADHCQVEMDRLHRMQLRSAHTDAAAAAPTATTTSSSSNNTASAATTTTTNTTTTAQLGDGSRRKPWTVFQRVQRNRQARQRQRTRKRPTPPPPAPAPAEPSCPVCNKHFPQADIQRHADQCLRSSRRNGLSNGERHSSDDDDDSEEYEEYEWAGQKRIRVSTLVQGGYSALSLGQTIKYNGNDDEDEDLNVDEDDTHIYGPTQYGEGDVIPLVNEDTDGDVSEADVTSYVRRLISSNETVKPNHSNEPTAAAAEQQQTTEAEAEAMDEAESLAPSTSRGSKIAQNQQQIIESLKVKLRLYEKQAQSKFKCLICIDDYKNPAISVSCWHVHCEQCWLQTLGARKLCPQCNSITTPKDLRRIYL